MTEDCQKMNDFLLKIVIKYMNNFMTEGSESGIRISFIRIRIRSKKIMTLDPVCPGRLDPDSANIRPEAKTLGKWYVYLFPFILACKVIKDELKRIMLHPLP